MPKKPTHEELEQRILELEQAEAKREMAEKLMRDGEEKYQELAESISDVFFAMDKTLRYTYWNKASEILTGVPAEKAVGKTLMEVFPDNDARHQVKKMYLRVIETKEPEHLTVNYPGNAQIIHEINTYPTREGVSVFIKDITERKQAEEALRESEKKYRTFLGTTSEGYWWLDPERKTIEVNTALCEMLGYSQDEMIEKTPFDFIDDENRKIFIEQTSKISSTSHRSYEIVLKKKNGENIYTYFNATTIMDKSGAVQGSFALITDITERKQTFERSERLNRLNEELLGSGRLNDKLRLITDEIVKIFKADFARIWIIKAGDLCDSECQHAKITEGPNVCHYRERCLHLLASSGRYTHIDGGHRRVPFGSYKIGMVAAGDEPNFLTNDAVNEPLVRHHEWARKLGLVSFAGYRLLSAAGGVMGVLALFSKQAISPQENALLENLAATTTQIIQTAKAEEALRKSEEKYRILFDSSRDAIMTLTPPTWLFTSANPATVELFKVRDEAEFMSLGPWQLSPERQPDGKPSDEKAKEMIETAMRNDSHFFEWTHCHYDGTPFPAEVLLTRMEQKGKVLLQATVRNITERKQAEEQRNKLISDLQKALSEVKTLRGFLPICSYCKNIRDDKGYWSKIESYIHKHSDAEFSHGICPECAKKHYPDFDLYDDNGEVTED